MNVLPRYEFKAPHNAPAAQVGCAAHLDPTCLCDVVFDTPAPYYKGEHKYHDMALNELDDWGVSERNVHEFLSIVMGVFTLETVLDNEYNPAPIRSPFLLGFGPETAVAIQNHLKSNSPWHVAYGEVPVGTDRRWFRDQYWKLQGTYRDRLFNPDRSVVLKAARREAKRASREIVHGNHGALRGHYRDGTPVCDECKAFHRERQQIARRRRRAMLLDETA
ncbi:MAG: hypothetical protein ACK53T_00170 [Planctomycetota bacterium]|jgi:hypothetical protein